MKPYYSSDRTRQRGLSKEVEKTGKNLSETDFQADEILCSVYFAQFILPLGHYKGVIFVRPDSEEFVANERNSPVLPENTSLNTFIGGAK